ncbi:MAG: hypothetical protein BWY09_01176 [Candidatus Hydrogenedentes bacterium ADurb.Bin179]|nr:MAG: hypothetical protein BWY09_01176 [Candidatus Hydrogenedentes bacterium ADurb.Bin179]
MNVHPRFPFQLPGGFEEKRPGAAFQPEIVTQTELAGNPRKPQRPQGAINDTITGPKDFHHAAVMDGISPCLYAFNHGPATFRVGIGQPVEVKPIGMTVFMQVNHDVILLVFAYLPHQAGFPRLEGVEFPVQVAIVSVTPPSMHPAPGIDHRDNVKSDTRV